MRFDELQIGEFFHIVNHRGTNSLYMTIYPIEKVDWTDVEETMGISDDPNIIKMNCVNIWTIDKTTENTKKWSGGSLARFDQDQSVIKHHIDIQECEQCLTKKD